MNRLEYPEIVQAFIKFKTQPINCGIIILAAGASTRMGRPKQLLPFNGKSLLAHAADQANGVEADPVILVLGADAALLEKEMDEKKLHIVTNPEWKEGMASSVRCGIQTLLQIAPLSDAAIIMVCDQPYLSADILKQLIQTQQQTGKLIVASQYGHSSGTPALFHKTIFPQLLQLKGDTGARKILQQQADQVITIPFPQGIFDMDTPEDYKELSFRVDR